MDMINECVVTNGGNVVTNDNIGMIKKHYLC